MWGISTQRAFAGSTLTQLPPAPMAYAPLCDDVSCHHDDATHQLISFVDADLAAGDSIVPDKPRKGAENFPTTPASVVSSRDFQLAPRLATSCNPSPSPCTMGPAWLPSPKVEAASTSAGAAFTLAFSRAIDSNATEQTPAQPSAAASHITSQQCIHTSHGVLGAFALRAGQVEASRPLLVCPALNSQSKALSSADATSPTGSMGSRGARKRVRGGQALRSSPPGAGADGGSPSGGASPSEGGGQAASGAGRKGLAISLDEAEAAGGAGQSTTPRKGEGSKRRRRKPHRPDSLMGAAAIAACGGRPTANSASSEASGHTPVITAARRTPQGTPGGPPSLMPPPQGGAAFVPPEHMVGFVPPAAATKLPGERPNLHRPQGKRADSCTAARLLEGTVAAVSGGGGHGQPSRGRTASFAELSNIAAQGRQGSSAGRRHALGTPASAAPAFQGGGSPAAGGGSAHRTPGGSAASSTASGRSMVQRRRSRTASFASLHRAPAVPAELAQRPASSIGGSAASTPVPALLSVDDLRASMPTASPAPRSHSAGAAAAGPPRSSPPVHLFGQLSFVGGGGGSADAFRPEALPGPRRMQGAHARPQRRGEDDTLHDATGLHLHSELHDAVPTGDSDEGHTTDGSDEDGAVARQVESGSSMPQPRSRSSSFAQAQAQRLSILQSTPAPLSPAAASAALRPMPFFPPNAQLPVSMAGNSASSSSSVFGSMTVRAGTKSSLAAVPLRTAASWESAGGWGGGWTHPSSTSAGGGSAAHSGRTQRVSSDLHLGASDADGSDSDGEAQPMAVDALLSTPQLGGAKAPEQGAHREHGSTDAEALLLPLAVPSMSLPEALELHAGGGAVFASGSTTRVLTTTATTAAPQATNMRPTTGQAVAAAVAAAAASKLRSSTGDGGSLPADGAASPSTPDAGQRQEPISLDLEVLQDASKRCAEALAPAFLLQQTMLAVEDPPTPPEAVPSMGTAGTAGTAGSSLVVGSSASSVDGGASTGRSTAGSDTVPGEDTLPITIAQRIAAAVSALPTWTAGLAQLEAAAGMLAQAGILQQQHVDDVRTARCHGDAMTLLRAASVVLQVTERVASLASGGAKGTKVSAAVPCTAPVDKLAQRTKAVDADEEVSAPSRRSARRSAPKRLD